MITRLNWFWVFITLAGQASAQQADTLWSLFLVGDAGLLDKSNNRVLDAIQQQVSTAPGYRLVVFLGDNVYPAGLPDSTAKDFPKAAAALQAQIDAAKSSNATLFIPGNHDWAKGAEQRDRQRYWLNRRANVKFLPHKDSPEVWLDTLGLAVIVLDTEWWIQTQVSQAPTLDSLLLRHTGKTIIVLGHHPLFTNGPHGGRFSLKTHLFPLTEVATWAYLPLPVLGSLYVLARRMGASKQDLAHPHNEAFRHALSAAFSKHGHTRSRLIYISGHEHNLQLLNADNVTCVVSGSGSKVSHVRKGKDFAASSYGFVVAHGLSDGAVCLVFHYYDQKQWAKHSVSFPPAVSR